MKQDETIGYIGNSGASTAPHLHSEYRVNGNPPTRARPRATTTLIPEQRTDFQSKSAALIANLEAAGEAVVTALLLN